MGAEEILDLVSRVEKGLLLCSAVKAVFVFIFQKSEVNREDRKLLA